MKCKFNKCFNVFMNVTKFISTQLKYFKCNFFILYSNKDLAISNLKFYSSNMYTLVQKYSIKAAAIKT